MSRVTPNFWDVKAILDWLTNNHTPAQLQTKHGPTFKWHTRDELLSVVVDLNDGGQTFPLIDSSLIGNGKGNQTNLIIALTDENGVAGHGQMPFGGNGDGQIATFLQIETIIRWIDAGCPA